jgi:hypothetical protein
MIAAITAWAVAAAFTTGVTHAYYKRNGWGYMGAAFCVAAILWPVMLGKIIGEVLRK